MNRSKNILIAALLSSIAGVSFAQTSVTPKPAPTVATNPAPAAAPADTASAVKKHHHHHKHHAKKAAALAPAASATK